MRVPRALFLLLLLTLAVPVGIGAYSASQQSTSADTQTVTLPNGQTVEIPADRAAMLASGNFPQGGFANTAAEAPATSIAVLGSVEENRVADLTFQSAGTVNEVLVQAGDYVEEGRY